MQPDLGDAVWLPRAEDVWRPHQVHQGVCQDCLGPHSAGIYVFLISRTCFSFCGINSFVSVFVLHYNYRTCHFLPQPSSQQLVRCSELADSKQPLRCWCWHYDNYKIWRHTGTTFTWTIFCRLFNEASHNIFYVDLVMPIVNLILTLFTMLTIKHSQFRAGKK